MRKIFLSAVVSSFVVVSFSACSNKQAETGQAAETKQEAAATSPAEKQIASIDEFEKAIAADENVLVDFYATWCGPCKVLEPMVVDLQHQYEGKVKVYRIDVDQAKELSKKMNVSSIPYLVFYKKGQLVKEVIGLQPAEQLQQTFKQAFSL